MISLRGSKARKKVVLVKYEDLCKATNLEGLGVKDMRCVDLALLSKWC